MAQPTYKRQMCSCYGNIIKILINLNSIWTEPKLRIALPSDFDKSAALSIGTKVTTYVVLNLGNMSAGIVASPQQYDRRIHQLNGNVISIGKLAFACICARESN